MPNKDIIASQEILHGTTSLNVKRKIDNIKSANSLCRSWIKDLRCKHCSAENHNSYLSSPTYPDSAAAPSYATISVPAKNFGMNQQKPKT